MKYRDLVCRILTIRFANGNRLRGQLLSGIVFLLFVVVVSISHVLALRVVPVM